jgi:uncharacterized cupin superfamily protein
MISQAPRASKVLDTPLQEYPPVREELIEGELAMRATVLWKSPGGDAATGIWQCPPVKLRLVHPFDETFTIVDGRLTITPEGGAPREMGPGDVIVLAENSVNVWEIHETVTKTFSVYRAGGLPI